jgi:phenylalanyl-tRNA synthetase beta chain
MKFSLSWLSEYIPVAISSAELSDRLTMVGLEVDSISDRYGYLDTVITGRIVETKPHPDAESMKLCVVDIGGEKLKIVCGAPNAETGMVTACAIPGTVFPDGRVLEKAVIHNKESNGMLCSEYELGLGPDSSGILSLNPDTAPGEKITKVLGLFDMVFEVDLTPNRPDCLGIIGIAREVAAIQSGSVRYPEKTEAGSGSAVYDFTSVSIQDPDLCPRYCARVVLDVTVGPSPFWLQDRLLSVGLRPINNLVDVTNFVMMETGQPLHAFDFDKLADNRIVVRSAEEGESFTTLDGKERKLSSGMLLICDAEKPVALAGVMGGGNTEISEETRSVLIESACFNPSSVRKTSKSLGLYTDASHRFERGVDPEGTVAALNRAAVLMQEITEGRLVEGVIDEHPGPAVINTIPLSVKNTNRLLGTDLDRKSMADHLKSIEFSVEEKGDDLLAVTVPSFRVDVSRHEDLVEEVARLSGYNSIPITFPLIPSDTRLPSRRWMVRNEIKNVLLGYGFSEAINYSFIDCSACEQLRLGPDDPRRNMLEILNPLSEDQSVMRTSLVPGIIGTMHRNVSMQIKTLKLFEIGKIFFDTGKNRQPREVENLVCIWTGKRNEFSWHDKGMDCDFYDIKGVAEGLFKALRVEKMKFTSLPAESCCYLKPGHTAGIYSGEGIIGVVGEIHPEAAANFDLKQSVFIFELDLDLLLPLIPEIKISKPLPKFPSVSRDITMIVDRDTEARSIIEHIESINEKILEKVQLFDVYEGKPVPEGKKSLSLRLIYRSPEKTLEDEFVNNIHNRISGTVLTAFNAKLP